jgi:myo-inositol-1(or 4)-monophosphatase
VHLPALGTTYAAARGAGATRDGAPIAVSTRPTLEDARIGGPKPAIEALARAGGRFEPVAKIPSLAYRLVCVADATLDAALAAPDAHDWDLAAADVILHEAGGALTDRSGERLVYNRPQPRHGGLLAAPRALHRELLALAGRALSPPRS